MNKRIISIWLSAMLIVGTAHSAHALYLYSVTLPLFTDGLDLETGEMQRDPTVLIVIFDGDAELEQVLTPEQVADFTAHPELDFSVDLDLGAVDPFLLRLQQPLEIALIKETSADLLGSVEWGNLIFQPFNPGDVLAFSLDDMLVFKMDAYTRIAMNAAYSGGIENLQLTAYQVSIPEPSLLVLVSLGLIGFLGSGLRRWQKRK